MEDNQTLSPPYPIQTEVKLIPKSWFVKEDIAHVNTINCVYMEELYTSCCKSVSNISIVTFTEPENFTKQ